jgi:repressor LexA
VLDFVRAFVLEHGAPPTVREIAGHLGVTPRAAFDHLEALERKGALRRRESPGRTARGLTPTEIGFRAAWSIPVLGRVAAGGGALAVETREGELHIAAESLPARPEELFALRVRGESMIEAHICPGDLVLVRRQATAEPNDVVVAMVEGEGEAEATVKRFQRAGDRVVLKPAHPTMAPVVVDPSRQRLSILGKVVGLLRGF